MLRAICTVKLNHVAEVISIGFTEVVRITSMLNPMMLAIRTRAAAVFALDGAVNL